MSETDFLRELVNKWKKDVGASYAEIANAIGLKSKSFIFDFLKGNKEISYESGCKLKRLVCIKKEEWESL